MASQLAEGEEVYIDEEWYLARYADVRKGVLAGRQKNALEHFLAHGRAEGRAAFAFDDDWYIETNPDVQVALKNGSIASARDHFVTHGRFESRRPVPPPLPERDRIFAFGAYGTNNVGDEAIFEGIKLKYPNVIQIFHHKSTCDQSIKIDFAFSYKKLFQKDSRLILGGGGLLYSRSAIKDMIVLAQAAVAVGARVDILGLGCEGAQDGYLNDVRRLVAMAETVTVRTSTSAEILRAVTGRDVERQHDFAFSLACERAPRERFCREIPLIGLVTGGDLRTDYSALVSVINARFRGPRSERTRFVHIPHSLAFDDKYNNDVLVGNAIWADLSLDKLREDTGLSIEPFCADPYKVLQLYSQLDGVMSARFHGMVFGRMMGLPVLALAAHTLKNQAFIRDYRHPDLFAPSKESELQDAFAPFFEAVKRGAVPESRPKGLIEIRGQSA